MLGGSKDTCKRACGVFTLCSPILVRTLTPACLAYFWAACFQNLLKSARVAVGCVERACEQIRCSDRLAHVLSRVLATGNVLNADTHRGGALAIKLDSLAKMSDVKVPLPGLYGS